MRQRRYFRSPWAIRFKGFVFYFSFPFWRVDPNCFWKTCGFGHAVDESLGIVLPGTLKRLFSGCNDFASLAVVQRCWSQQANAAVIMLVVVPANEFPGELQGIFVASKPLWKFRTVLHCFELAFRERIVVGNMRSTV